MGQRFIIQISGCVYRQFTNLTQMRWPKSNSRGRKFVWLFDYVKFRRYWRQIAWRMNWISYSLQYEDTFGLFSQLGIFYPLRLFFRKGKWTYWASSRIGVFAVEELLTIFRWLQLQYVYKSARLRMRRTCRWGRQMGARRHVQRTKEITKNKGNNETWRSRHLWTCGFARIFLDE